MLLAPVLEKYAKENYFSQISPENVSCILKATETKQIYINESGKLSGNACARGGSVCVSVWEMRKIREM